jgi:hypothetical protein
MTVHDLEQYLQSPAASAINLSLAGLGIVLAIYFYVKGKKQRRARYSDNSRTLIESKETPVLPGIQILFRDTPQDRITVTKVGIWNAGSEPLRPEDVATARPLSIEVAPDAEVLDTELVFSTDPANRFQISSSERNLQPDGKHSIFIPFSFEFLDPQQGAVVQIVHTGAWNHPFRVTGKIIGARPVEGMPSPQRDRSRMQTFISRWYRRIGLIGAGALVVLGLAAVTFKPAGILIAVWGCFTLLGLFLESSSRIPKAIADALK